MVRALTSELDSAGVVRVDDVHEVLNLLHGKIEAGVEQDAAELGPVDLGSNKVSEMHGRGWNRSPLCEAWDGDDNRTLPLPS